MAQANGVHMVPEKYRKTRFMASCWFYLSQNADLSFKEYQRLSKDTVCRESIFDDVKKLMSMDRVFGNKDAVHPPGAAAAPEKQHPPQPPPPPNPAMKEALTTGLARAGQQSAKGPITIERRALAEDWIRGHLDEGFAQFKLHHQEPELDKAWFDKIRKKALEPAPPQEIEPMPTATLKKKTGKAASPDTEKLRTYLRSLSREKLDNLTHKKYVEATRHKSLVGPTFYNEKRKIMDSLDGKVKESKGAGRPKGSAKKTKPPGAGAMFVTLAEIPVADFKAAPKDLKEFALALVRALHPQGKEAEVRILSEPHALEIRVPYR